jgi:hypothetical protein
VGGIRMFFKKREDVYRMEQGWDVEIHDYNMCLESFFVTDDTQVRQQIKKFVELDEELFTVFTIGDRNIVIRLQDIKYIKIIPRVVRVYD